MTKNKKPTRPVTVHSESLSGKDIIRFDVRHNTMPSVTVDTARELLRTAPPETHNTELHPHDITKDEAFAPLQTHIRPPSPEKHTGVVPQRPLRYDS